MAPMIKDVAKRAGVSVITVSRVLNNAEYVRAETQARVLAAIDELQYVPNQLASSLRSRQNDTLALVVPDIATTFWTAMARGAEDAAWDSGFSLFLCNTDEDPAKEGRYVENLLRHRVAGIAIAATLNSTALLTRLQTHSLPFVMLHRKIAGIAADVVRSDSRAGAMALTQRLLDKGLRRIAYVGGPLAGSVGQDRLAGYREALTAAGIVPDPALIKIGLYTQQSGYELVGELLKLRPFPEGICVGNSRLALGALHALLAAGVRAPDDIAVATFFEISSLIDDSRLLRTPLIIATQPTQKIGHLGIRRLLSMLPEIWHGSGGADRREVLSMLYVTLTEGQRAELVAYQARGIAGLQDLPRRGRPPRAPLAGAIVDAQASQSPRCAGLVQTCWTVTLLAAFLAARFGLALSATSVRRHLKASGWRWRRPRLAPASARPPKRDPEAAANNAAIHAALCAARRSTCHLVFLDECDLHLLPTLRACWQKGPRLRVPTPGTNAKRAFFGALDAASGVFHTADCDRKLAAHFVAFLRQLAAAYPTGPLILALDNVRMHDAKLVRQWLAANPRVAVLWFPKYAAVVGQFDPGVRVRTRPFRSN